MVPSTARAARIFGSIFGSAGKDRHPQTIVGFAAELSPSPGQAPRLDFRRIFGTASSAETVSGRGGFESLGS